MTEHPGEQFPPDVDPDVEPYPSEEESTDQPDYDAEPGSQNVADAHVDPAEVEFGPEFARPPGEEHEHAFVAESAEDPSVEEPQTEESQTGESQTGESQTEEARSEEARSEEARSEEARSEEARSEEGHPLVEETMDRLHGLRDRPVSEHAEVYADLHERLQSALVEADAEHGDRA